jgi:hypothetical protein
MYSVNKLVIEDGEIVSDTFIEMGFPPDDAVKYAYYNRRKWSRRSTCYEKVLIDYEADWFNKQRVKKNDSVLAYTKL